jgi:hypothetical protein
MRKTIDRGIKGLVNELNRHGLKTLYSCAGHKDVVNRKGKNIPDKTGYVVMKGFHDAGTVKDIASKYVKGVKVRTVRMTHDAKNENGRYKTYVATEITFKPKNLQKWGGG